MVFEDVEYKDNNKILTWMLRWLDNGSESRFVHWINPNEQGERRVEIQGCTALIEARIGVLAVSIQASKEFCGCRRIRATKAGTDSSRSSRSRRE